MRRLIALCLAPLIGCASTGTNVEVKTLYRPAVFGSVIGEVIRITDEETGLTIYYVVGKEGAVKLGEIRGR